MYLKLYSEKETHYKMFISGCIFRVVQCFVGAVYDPDDYSGYLRCHSS